MIAEKHYACDDWDYVITHGSVLRAVIDYVFKALQGRGRIVVGDGPQTDSFFGKIVERMGLLDIQSLYRSEHDFALEILDLRDEQWSHQGGVYLETTKLAGDPNGQLAFDLKDESMFSEVDDLGRRYYGAYYDIAETNHHHRKGRHEYAIAATPIRADVFINVPKLKTHKKCGLTVNLKSLVGINANKNWLPHYAFGSPDAAGDQFPESNFKHRIENALVIHAKRLLLMRNRLYQLLATKFRKTAYSVLGTTEEVVRSGNWHGNDTTWRMCLDLNRILTYGNGDGSMREADRPKRFFSLVDGIAGMEGNGPVGGTRKESGVVIAGGNPVAVDMVCAKLMGFDFKRLPLIYRCLDEHRYPLMLGGENEIEPISNEPSWNRPLDLWEYDHLLHFKPHFGWIGAIEVGR